MGLRGPVAKPGNTSQRGRRKITALTIVHSAVDIPPLPAIYVGDEEREPRAATITAWNGLWQSDVASAIGPADMARLVRWITALDEWLGIQPVVRKAPLLTGQKRELVINPLVRRQKQLEEVMASAEREFGMTPMSRARLGLTVGQAKLTAADLNARVNRDRRPATEDATLTDEYDPG